MKDADGLHIWYSPRMKKHRTPTGSSADPITKMAATVSEVMAERTRMNKELLEQLVLAMAANERAQRRFRNAVLIRLSKIETIVAMIHGAQIVESQWQGPLFEEKATKLAEDAEEYISRKSNELGLAMVKYVYEESEAPSPPSEGRRKRSARPGEAG